MFHVEHQQNMAVNKKIVEQCFACSESVEEAGELRSIYENDERMVEFLLQVGIEVPLVDKQRALLLCNVCEKTISKFRNAFFRFTESLQDGVKEQLRKFDQTAKADFVASPRSINQATGADFMEFDEFDSTNEADLVKSDEQVGVREQLLEFDDLDQMAEGDLATSPKPIDQTSKTEFVTSSSSTKTFANENPEHSSNFKCRSCPERFNSYDKLRSHFKLEHPENLLRCDSCPLTFCSLGGLKGHKYNKHANKIFECKICKQVLSYSSSLRMHMVIHSDERPFKCEICKMAFKRRSDVRGHSAIHFKQKV